MSTEPRVPQAREKSFATGKALPARTNARRQEGTVSNQRGWRPVDDGELLNNVRCPKCGYYKVKLGGCLGCVGRTVWSVGVLVGLIGLVALTQSTATGISILVVAVVMFVGGIVMQGVLSGYHCTNCGYNWKK